MISKEFFLDILSSVIASFVFLFLVLLVFKPKIRISPFICKGKFASDDPLDYFFIKIINISFFSAYDAKFELLLVDKYPTTNGQMNCRLTDLSLVSDSISNIKGYRPSWIRKNAPYALRIRTKDDLSAILTNDYKSVMIKVSLRHGLTGLAKVHTRDYTDINQIKNGKFEYGLNFGDLP